MTGNVLAILKGRNQGAKRTKKDFNNLTTIPSIWKKALSGNHTDVTITLPNYDGLYSFQRQVSLN